MTSMTSNKLIAREFVYVLTLAGVFAGTPLCWAETDSRAALSHKGPNVKIDSSELEPFSLNEKTEPKEKPPVFYSDQNSSIELNDNGEANLNTRF